MTLTDIVVATLRKGYTRFFPPVGYQPHPSMLADADEVSRLLSRMVEAPTPTMVARFGSGEIDVVTSYVGQTRYKGLEHLLGCIKGETPKWWWTKSQIRALSINAGFFNPSRQGFEKFSRLMLEDMQLVDVLGSWVDQERFYKTELQQAQLVRLRFLEPFWSQEPWTKSLRGKRVLVVHPFAKTIEEQYKHRDKLFANPNILPEFASLTTIQAVQSIGNEAQGFDSWFDALHDMETKMDQVDYDVALIGCGAYGFPLAAHAKRMGKKGFHLGGSLQLLFGIKGKRWFDPANVYHYSQYSPLCNAYWVEPSINEKPKAAGAVENECYW
ncbi:MAG: hypothetical protein I3J02_10420 [Prevotella sp.]|nr:hypothetical protein [Prevotella sp.]